MAILRVIFLTVLVIGLIQVSRCEEENDEQENVDEDIDETTGELDDDEEETSSDEEDEDENNDEADNVNEGGNNEPIGKEDEQANKEHQSNVQSDDPKVQHPTNHACQTIDKSEISKLCARNWTAKIYYDPGQKLWERCQFFYYGGCSSMKKELIFENEAECFNKCESKETMDCNFYHSSKYCFGEYDPSKWTLFYTHDPIKGKCIQSWYGGCSNFNVYKTLEQCQQKCEKNRT